MLSHGMLQNKYTKWYFSIVDSYSKQIEEGIYCENHHIMPKCIELYNSKENFVRVRMKDHVILHHLLTKMFKGQIKYKMMQSYHATVFMKGSIHSPIRIERARSYVVETKKGSNNWMYGRTKEKNHFYGKQHTEESKNQTSNNRKGKCMGENNPNSKFSDLLIENIRMLYNKTDLEGRKIYTQTELANMFGVSQSQVHYIVNFKQRL